MGPFRGAAGSGSVKCFIDLTHELCVLDAADMGREVEDGIGSGEETLH